MRSPLSTHQRRRTRQRGVVLVVALLFLAIIALGLASFLNLNLTSNRLSQRTFRSYAALNLAEAGTEEGLWSFNRASSGVADAWSSWSPLGTAAVRKFNEFDLGPGFRGEVKVYVSHRDPAASVAPKIIAQASAESGADSPVSKMIEVTLRRRSVFSQALVARDAIVFSGANAQFDAWNSDPDNNASTPPVDYSAAVRSDRGTLATTSANAGALQVNDAHIWGYVATGGAPPVLGAEGSIRGASTPADVRVDASRVGSDFDQTFAPVSAPEDGTVLATLPSVLGTPGTSTRWRTARLTLSGNASLTIEGQVTLTLTDAAGADAVRVVGNAAIVITPGSSLTLFTAGTVRIAGNGVVNANISPSSFQLWGTSSTEAGQSIELGGQAVLRAAVYAPFADISVNGNGAVLGSMVARRIQFTGNAAFHYDEALAQGSSGDPFRIEHWRELTSPAERAAYLPLFNGW